MPSRLRASCRPQFARRSASPLSGFGKLMAQVADLGTSLSTFASDVRADVWQMGGSWGRKDSLEIDRGLLHRTRLRRIGSSRR